MTSTFVTMNDRLQKFKLRCPRRRSGSQSAKAHLLAALTVIAAGMFCVDHAMGQVFSTTWNRAAVDGPGDFGDNGNWTDDSPAFQQWFIDNGGTAVLSEEKFLNSGFLGTTSLDTGNLTISSGGKINVSLPDEDLAVGKQGTGLLTINSGGAVIRTNMFIAGEAGSAGTVNINRGQLTTNVFLHIGHGGSGNLTLSGNGTILSLKGDIGRNSGAIGTATIADGLWQNTDAIFVGVDGNGTLAVNAQGRITSKSLYIGQNASASASGATTVSGGSITLSETLAVGVSGTGNLTVTGGGLVSAEFVQVGLETGSVGAATISSGGSLTGNSSVQVGVNAGSTGTLTLAGTASLNTPSFIVGNAGSGTVHIENATLLSTPPTITVAQESGSTGVLNVTGTTLQVVEIVGGNGSATVNLDDGTALAAGFAGGNLTISGFSAGGFNLSGNVTFDSEGLTIQVNNSLSGTGRLIKTGVGDLNLTAASTYTGGTEIQRFGFVNVSHADALGTGNITNNGILQAMSTLTIGSGISQISVQANQFGDFGAQEGSTLTLAPGSFQLGSNATFISGIFSGTNSTVVFAPGAATAVEPGTGEVQLYSGTLRAGNAQLAALTAQAGTTTVSSNTTLDFQDHLAGGGIRNLQGNGTVHIGSNASTTLSVNSGNFSGTITGSGGLVKTSSDTLILSGFSEFTGGTTIDEGVLIVNGALLTGLGTVEVNVGGTLGGTGFVGPVNLSGGSIAPGNSPGTLFPTEILWYDGDIVFELGPTQATSDFINTGKLAGFGTTYAFTFVDQGMVNGTTYDLISFDPTLAAAIPVGNFTFTNGGGFDGTFSYRSESASTSYLQFTVIPEPTTWALLLLTATLLAVRGGRICSVKWRSP